MKQNDQLYEQIKDLLDAKLEPIKDEISEINKAVNGNGQPGLRQRVMILERDKNIALGGWKMAGLIISIFVGSIALVLNAVRLFLLGK